MALQDDLRSELADGPLQGIHPSGPIPRFRRSLLQRVSSTTEPDLECREAVLLRADIVAFTALTDKMVAGGPAGAERLASLIDEFIGTVARIAARHGGEVALLAGDAVIIAWVGGGSVADMSEAATLACETASELQRRRAHPKIDGQVLSFRASIGVGSLCQFEVGGVEREWHMILSGVPLAECLAGALLARPGDTVLSASALQLVGFAADVTPVEDGFARLNGIRAVTPRWRALSSAELASTKSAVQTADPVAAQDSGDGSVSGLFRTVTAVFFSVKHPALAKPIDQLAALQAATSEAQACVSRYGGDIHQVRDDENGTIILAVFGLPPSASEDDPGRAVRAALALHRKWAEHGMTTSTGIATGRVFCATMRGTNQVTLFTLVGPVMNLAARLMQLNAGVVCDHETTRSGRQQRIRARELAPRRLKGIGEPLVAYAPYQITDLVVAGVQAGARPVGRDDELAFLNEGVDALLASRASRFLIEGEAGIGKSTLVGNMLDLARSQRIDCLVGGGDESERSSPYLAWRPIFRAHFDVPESASSKPTATIEFIARELGADRDLAPLLAEVLGLPLSDNDRTLRLVGEARSATTQRLLLACLRRRAATSKQLIAIEDVHWLDSNSMALLTLVAESSLPMLLVSTSRRVSHTDQLYDRLARARSTKLLMLKGLDADHTRQMLAQVTGARASSSDLAHLVLDWTDGNPLFITELVPVLLRQNLINVKEGVASLAVPPQIASEQLSRSLSQSGSPSTLDGIVTARFDQLAETHKALLRGISVAGAVTLDEQDIFFPTIPGGAVATALNDLIEAAFLVNLSTRSYAFRHVVLRDIVYQSMSYADRRRLHGLAAQAILRRSSQMPEQADAQLARHFDLAGNRDQAVLYGLRAARRALVSYANIEAAGLAERVSEIVETQISQGDARRARHAQLCEAYLALGSACHRLSRYEDARRHGEAGLRLLGFAVPRMNAILFLATLKELVAQIRRRLLPFSVRRPSQTRRDQVEKALAVLEYLTEIHFFNERAVPAIYSTLRSLNLAERASLSAGKALASANLAGIAGVVPARRIMRHYRALALRELHKTDDLHAHIWVSTVAALTHISGGEWEQAQRLVADAVAAAEKSNDRRSWRAAIELNTVIDASRGDWNAATDYVEAMLQSAERDHDHRAVISAVRERAYINLRRGDVAAAEVDLSRIRAALEAGVTAEEATIRQEVGALEATIALEKEDFARAEVRPHPMR